MVDVLCSADAPSEPCSLSATMETCGARELGTFLKILMGAKNCEKNGYRSGKFKLSPVPSLRKMSSISPTIVDARTIRLCCSSIPTAFGVDVQVREAHGTS